MLCPPHDLPAVTYHYAFRGSHASAAACRLEGVRRCRPSEEETLRTTAGDSCRTTRARRRTGRRIGPGCRDSVCVSPLSGRAGAGSGGWGG